MSNALAACALLAAVAGGSLGPAPAPLLTLEVAVVDGRGAPVTDVKPSEFEVWINGFRIPIQEVTFVSPSTRGRGRPIVLLLDDLTVHPTVLPRVREAARRFVEQMRDGDTMAIVTLDGVGMKTTDQRAVLRQAIDRYHVRGRVLRIEDLARQVFDAVAELSRQLTEAPGGRKAIVAIGSGWLFDRPIQPIVGSQDLRDEWVAAMRAAASAHVSFYVIDPGGVGSRPVTGGTSGFASETGGHAFTNTNDLEGAADRILRELDTYYELAIEDPPLGRKDDLRKVDVKVARRDVAVRARKGIPGR